MASFVELIVAVVLVLLSVFVVVGFVALCESKYSNTDIIICILHIDIQVHVIRCDQEQEI